MSNAHAGEFSRAEFGICSVELFARSGTSTKSDWMQQVRAWIEGIDAAENIHVAAEDLDVSVADEAPDRTFPSDGRWHPLAARVSYKLRIPERVQESFQTPGKVVRPGCEEFFVCTVYRYHGAATFVFCENSSSGDVNPSAAASLVSAYLRREVSRKPEITLTTVHPDTFPANFELKVAKIDGVSVARTPSSGYDDIVITAPVDDPDLKNLKAVAGAMIDGFSDDLCLYYNLRTGVMDRRNKALEVETLSDSLMEKHLSTGSKAALSRLFTSARAARRLALTAIKSETANRRFYEQGRKAVEQTRAVYPGSVMLEDLQRALDEGYHRETFESARDAARLLESVRTRQVEVSILAASTLLGALAGATASLFSRGILP